MIHDNSNIFQHDLEIKTVDTILDSNAEISRNFKKDDYIAENIENDKNKIFNSMNTLKKVDTILEDNDNIDNKAEINTKFKNDAYIAGNIENNASKIHEINIKKNSLQPSENANSIPDFGHLESHCLKKEFIRYNGSFYRESEEIDLEIEAQDLRVSAFRDNDYILSLDENRKQKLK